MVIKKSFWKNAFKSIKGNISRFIAMLSIILLSSGVITGLLVSAPNMEMSMSEEYNKYNTADIQLISDLGFDNDSIKKVNTFDQDFVVQPFNIYDKQVKVSNGSNSISISSLLYELDFDDSKVNQFELISGNYPVDEFDILAERSSYHIEEVEVGNKVLIDGVEYNVSGVVANTWYFSKEAERSIETSNTVKGIFYKNFNYNNMTYTNLFIKVNKSLGLNQFSESYTNLINKKTKSIEEGLSNLLLQDRLDKLDSTKSIEELNLHVLNRTSNISYQTYKTFVNKVSTITQIFPIFFLIVSILVVLTTMTRMIEEERQQIGILRSLGYSRASIYYKYLFYGLIVGIIGAGVGYAAGFRLIPSIINTTFQTVFHLKGLNMNIFSLSNILYLIFIVISILLTTIFAVTRTLRQNVASLLLPKSPKFGTRILLEKITFFWKHLKFKYKSSLRNLFRYPNHFAMTVIGIAGSLALIITGLALSNSISDVTKIQYGEIIDYNFTVDINGFDSNFDSYLNDKYDDNIYIMESTYMVTTKKTNENIYVNAIIVDGDLNGFINLRTRKKHLPLDLTNDGVIISEQLANYMQLKVGDIFEATKTDDLKINGIAENYLNSYVYMTKEYYENSFKATVRFNRVLVKSSDFNRDEVSDELLMFNNVLNTNFLIEEIEAKDRLLNQVNILAIIIILAACFLAIVVIYNLTNVNISEREKELSTLKVLGYKNTEVSSYIYREINIMTLVAIIIGTPLGVLLNRYIIHSIEEPEMMMGQTIKWYSFIIAIALTILVTILVELVMSFKIKKIDMIGALKEL